MERYRERKAILKSYEATLNAKKGRRNLDGLGDEVHDIYTNRFRPYKGIGHRRPKNVDSQIVPVYDDN